MRGLGTVTLPSAETLDFRTQSGEMFFVDCRCLYGESCLRAPREESPRARQNGERETARAKKIEISQNRDL